MAGLGLGWALETLDPMTGAAVTSGFFPSGFALGIVDEIQEIVLLVGGEGGGLALLGWHSGGPNLDCEITLSALTAAT